MGTTTLIKKNSIMRRQDKKKVINEANQRLEREYLKSKGLLKENKAPKLSKKEVDVISNILEGDILGEGEEVLAEGNFSKVREKFNSALKKGAMTLGILSAILGSPNMAQAQKTQLKKDVTNSTWFMDQERSFQNDQESYSKLMGRYVNNPDYDQDLEDVREPGTPDDYSMEKWVNNLGQDSTVYKQYQDNDQKFNQEKGKYEWVSSNPSDPIKTVVNKDVKPWAGKDWAQLTKKGNIGDYLWSKDKKVSITPEIHKQLNKLEKGKKFDYKDRKSVQAKKYKDGGFSSSDFYTVDLQNIQSPGK
tara:strand:- start:3 stop:914 length:912 start_codon:yes stop_codon:yes gene_type:complete